MTWDLEVVCLIVGLVSHLKRNPVTIDFWFLFQTLCRHLRGTIGTQLLCLCEVYHHACSVTLHLRPNLRKSTLVVLLHIATRFRELVTNYTKQTKGHDTQPSKKHTGGLTVRYINKLEFGMLSAINLLPDTLEEKQMLVKKLSDSLEEKIHSADGDITEIEETLQ